MINAGAIVVASLIKNNLRLADRFDYVSHRNRLSTIFVSQSAISSTIMAFDFLIISYYVLLAVIQLGIHDMV